MPDSAIAKKQVATERSRLWERRLQSVMLTFVSGLMVWLVSTVSSVASKTAGMEAQLNGMAIQLAAMYRKDDAVRDRADMERQLSNAVRRLDALELQVTNLQTVKR